MKKLLSLLTFAILVLAGCGSSATGEGDDVLTIMSYYEATPKYAADYYEQMTGQKVEFVTVGYEDYQTKLNTVLGTSDAPDIVFFDQPFLGSYIYSDNMVAFEDVFEDQTLLDDYKANVNQGAIGPGTVDGKTKAIGWEVSPASFYYRKDLAQQCLGINSVEEMEAATTSMDDLYGLYDQLQASSDEACSSLSMFSYPDYEFGLLDAIDMYNIDAENKQYVIPSEFDAVLDEIKENNSNGFVYSPNADNSQVNAGISQDKIFGNIAPSWATESIREYLQDNKWAIADAPLDYATVGTTVGITANADYDMVEEFFDTTFFNPDWYLNDVSNFSLVANDKIMDQIIEANGDQGDDYFGGVNVQEKFSEINEGIDGYNPVSPYDIGLKTSIDEVIDAYAINNTISTTQEAKEMLKEKMNTLYPDLDVVIE